MLHPDLKVHSTENGLMLPLHVQTRAKRNEISGVYNGALKIKITAPPVDNAANRAITEFMASRLSVPKSRLSILSGARSRDKVLHIEGMFLEEFHKKLNAV